MPDAKSTSPSLGAALAALLRRDLLLAYRNRAELINPPLFFLMVISMFPLGVGMEPERLAQLAPGLIWVIALLATLLSLDGLFRSDFEDGSLEQLLLSPHSLYFAMLVKIFAHWLVTGLPLTLMAPVLGLMLNLPGEAFWALLLSLLIGSASLSLLGAIGAALTVSLKRGGLLISLIIMPLYVPVLVFGSGVVQAAALGDAYTAPLAMLGAISALALLLSPVACAGSLKIMISQ